MLPYQHRLDQQCPHFVSAGWKITIELAVKNVKVLFRRNFKAFTNQKVFKSLCTG